MKHALRLFDSTTRKYLWVTQRRIGVPSLTDNIHLRYTWPSAEAAEQQRPLYESALKCQLEVEPAIPQWQIDQQEDEESEKFQNWPTGLPH
jgi:hypothetical protein